MHDEHRKRLRERFIKEGIDSFEAHQILELMMFYTIPRKDTNETAHLLLDKFGTFANVLDAPVKELMEVKGVGENTALFLNMIPQIMRRYENSKLKVLSSISSTAEAGEYVKSLFHGRIYECFFLICLNAQNKVVHTEKISEGTPNETSVYPRNVVRIAIQNNATSVILAHNHPGGSITPSSSDIESTAMISSALKTVDIGLMDHIVVANNSYFSMRNYHLCGDVWK